MAYSALFAFTSLWEGLGFVIIESLAVGTPVVSVDCPSGPSEILQGGKYGRLVPVGDDLAMSQAILETLNKPLPRDLLQEAARPYSVSAATTAYLDAFGLPANYAD
jgi:glycosyltransferase involved in cell wall biosynthesis